jgi:hypothetical protein
VPGRYRPPAASRVFSWDDRVGAFRRYVFGSSATDEREPYIALSRMNPARLDFDPRGFLYGGAYLYPVGGLLYVLKSAGLFDAEAGTQYFLGHPEDLRRMYLAGRSLGLLAFLGVMAVLGLLGNATGRPAAGTIAMSAWGLSTLPLNQAVVSKPHVWAAFWFALMVYVLYRHGENPRRRHLILGGSALGLAAGSSMFAAVGAFTAGALLKCGRVRAWLPRLAILLCVTLLVYCASNPYVLMKPKMYLVTILHHGSGEGFGYAVAETGKGLRCIGDFLLRSFAFPLALLGAGQAAVSLVRGDARGRRLAWGWFVSFVALSFTVGLPRILLFMGPVLCFFAGQCLERILEALRPRARAIRVAVASALFAPGLFFAALFARDSIDDTPWLEPTADWIASGALADGTVVGVFGAPTPKNSPPLPFLGIELANLQAPGSEGLAPRYVLLGNFGSDRRAWESHPLRSSYRLVRVLGYRSSHGWFRGLRVESESRVAGWVYERVSDGPPPAP